MSTALQILQAASDVVDGFGCDCSTECCRFGVTGREPWLTRAEFDVVTAAVKAQGRRLPVPDDDDGEARCVFLGSDDRCRIYAARPLGCRTFFCDKTTHPDGRTGLLPSATNKALREFPRQLQALTPNEESKPLGAWLRAASSSSSKKKRR
ncbi:MAG: YkgJ family cysteine cluster protein [Deltaproteobacteria bacterium]|nr:YkgJ family cysteine cluster protein [Deltaproteobacteria bacterium]